MFRISALTPEHAAAICTWRYPAPYDRYDMVGAAPADLLDPGAGFHAVLDDDDALAGFRSYGADGRVPGWDYDDTALDTGGGLRPDLVGLGRGLGRAAIAAGLEHGRRLHAPSAFRVTVASSNARALHTVGSLGFERVARFAASTDGRSYDVLVLPVGG